MKSLSFLLVSTCAFVTEGFAPLLPLKATLHASSAASPAKTAQQPLVASNPVVGGRINLQGTVLFQDMSSSTSDSILGTSSEWDWKMVVKRFCGSTVIPYILGVRMARRPLYWVSTLVFWIWYVRHFNLTSKTGGRTAGADSKNVVFTQEQENKLEAWKCKQCGSMMFFARGREGVFKNQMVEKGCVNCGATGEDNFYSDRKSVVKSVQKSGGAKPIHYENPLRFLSVKERQQLLKKAGGDVKVAEKMALEIVLKKEENSEKK
eukprot:Nitzschia sp. Nitz4//scaffold58_size112336//57061//57849//NITZ4_004035-RA/size112336-processed-gene-0.219-mRNA-1//-1//CDS//3329554995//464//frame0